MAEDDNHQIRSHSTQKSHAQTTSSLLQPKKIFSPPNSPANTENSSGNPSRSRQLWNFAVDSVLEHEKTTPMISSAAGNEPIGWYNLTKR